MTKHPKSGVSRALFNVPELEAHFRTIVTLMYDTSIPLSVLEEKICPYLAPDVAFSDPWLRSQGYQKIRIGMRGFHCAFRFEFDIHQLAVQPDDKDGRSGRALIEGVMNLRSIPGYVYPLRSILTYDFTLNEQGEPRITRIEEIWSVGDMIKHAPLGIGWFYERFFRPAAGHFFVGFFWLACKLRGGPSEK